MDVDTDQKQARNTQQTTNWQQENNDAGNNLAWHAASATGSRTYMGHHNTGVLTSYTEGEGFAPNSQSIESRYKHTWRGYMQRVTAFLGKNVKYTWHS